MPQFLLPDFLNDPAQYEQAESIWQHRWESLIHQLGQSAIWQSPWINTKANDGTLLRDGNPIFSAVSPSRRLGVRVIQMEPADDPCEWSAWTDTFAKGDPEEIKELVIDCVLSDESLRQAFDLMRMWIEPDRNGLAQLEAILGQHDSADVETAE